VTLIEGIQMFDLFGDSVTSPQTQSHSTKLNSAQGFLEFWKAWPSGIRKVAKQQCLNKWSTLGCADVAEHICKHIAWMKTQEDWQKQNGAFIPMPATYLNQQRWIDWEPPVRPAIDPAEQTRIMLAERDKKAAPMPQDVRERLNALRRASA
jgi:hypothetical protein